MNEINFLNEKLLGVHYKIDGAINDDIHTECKSTKIHS